MLLTQARLRWWALQADGPGLFANSDDADSGRAAGYTVTRLQKLPHSSSTTARDSAEAPTTSEGCPIQKSMEPGYAHTLGHIVSGREGTDTV